MDVQQAATVKLDPEKVTLAQATKGLALLAAKAPESAVVTYDQDTGELTARWANQEAAMRGPRLSRRGRRS